MSKKVKNVERYNPNLNVGLSNEQVAERLENNLSNKTMKKYSKSFLAIFCSNIFTFFNLLGAIVFIALLYNGAPISDFFFVMIYLANIALGIIQEIRAKVCIDKLSLISSKNSTVLRNGKLFKVASDDIVLDDIVLLELGNQIPADSVILSGEIEVNESLITGESVPVKKVKGDKLFAGSFVVGGSAKVQALFVGDSNYVSKLSEKARKYKKPYSELMDSLNFIIKIVGIIIIPIATAWILKSSLIFHEETKDIISRTATVIIGMIPSGMFLLTSMALAVGVIKLAGQKTLVQDLYSLETLARVDTVCFDKTGTITDGKMSVNDIYTLSTESQDDLCDIMSSMIEALKDENQTSKALQDKFGKKKVLTSKAIIPFNSMRKFSAVSFSEATYAFGAPEFVLSKEEYKKISKKINDLAKQGLRVILLAKSLKQIENDKAPDDFMPIGIITIVDHIREDAIETIKWFKENDVAIKVISGDNPITVSEVSKRVGVENADKFISLEGLSDEEVRKVANDYVVFGRVSPEQKAIIIKAINDNNHITAMTGDGVNDILALKEADCAISVASGSEAAKNLSNIVLMDNNFNSLPKVVFEGRRVINNIQRSASLYIMKTIFTMLIAIITLCFPNEYTYPFELSQMLMLEVFVIGLPSFILSLQANTQRVEGSFISYVLKKSLPSAFLMVLGVFVLKFIMKTIGDPYGIENTMGVYILTFAGLISLFNICRPFNFLRVVLMVFTTTILTVISAYAIFNGFDLLKLTKMVPLINTWKYHLIDFIILATNIPVSIILQRLLKNVNFKSKFKRKRSK